MLAPMPSVRRALIVAVTVAGCGAPASLPDHHSEELALLPFAPSIRGRDGGYSAQLGGRSVWVFGDTPLEVEAVDGERWRTSTFTTTVDDDASDGLAPFVEPLDANGAPYQLIPFTAEEAAYNASQSAPACEHDCAPKWVLWPGGVAVAPSGDEALVFYWKIRDWEAQGTGLARWKSPDAPLERLTFKTDPDEPSALFGKGEHELGNAVLVDGDTLYVYGCEHEDFFDFDCVIGRVPFSSAIDRDAWEFWDGGDWTPTLADATSVLNGASILTVHYNAHAGRYVAVYAKTDDEIVARTATRPHGPWSDEELLHTGQGHEDGSSIYDAIVHPELSQEDGRLLYVSYSRGVDFLKSEMHLVQITFEP